MPLHWFKEHINKRKNVFLRYFPFIVFLILWGRCGSLLASQSLIFEQVSIAHGLSQSSVTVMIQDSRGFIWCGTQDGLNRYDGYEFVIYRENLSDSCSISDNSINALVEDTWGGVWVGTVSGGLNRFDPVSNCFERFELAVQELNSSHHLSVLELYIENRNTLWIGTLGGGLFKMDIPSRQITQCMPSTAAPKQIYALFPYKEALMWLTTEQGMLWYDTVGDSLLAAPPVPEALIELGQKYNISAFQKDRRGRLWLGTYDNGLFRYHEKTGDMAHWPTSQTVKLGGVDAGTITDIVEDNQGRIWVGSDQSGLLSIDRETEQFSHYENRIDEPGSLGSNEVYDLLIDVSGLLWVATVNGLNKLSPSSIKFRQHPFSQLSERYFKNTDIWAFLKDSRGNTWFGTSRGVYEYQGKSARLLHHRGGQGQWLTDNLVYSLMEDQQGEIWIGCRSGVTHFTPKTKHLQKYSFNAAEEGLQGYSATCMHVDPTEPHVVWIGTMAGLNRFNKASGENAIFSHAPDDVYSLADNYISMIHFDRNHEMWLATGQGGLDRYDKESGRFIHHNRESHGFISDRLTCIHEDEAHVFWVGTFGGGLFSFHPESGALRNYNMQDGLPNTVVYGIKQDSRGYLWISSNKGLSRFHRETNTFINYDMRWGLQNSEFNQGAAYQDSDSLLYFGGINGFNVFYGQNLSLNYFAPPVCFTDFKLFNRDVPIRKQGPLKGDISAIKGIELKHNENSLTLVFAALDFHIPDRNNYAVKLDPMDEDWEYLGHNRVYTISHLRPGEYTFRVKASNADGIWNNEGTSLAIRIRPPMQQTLWFRSLMAILILGLVLAGHTYRTRLLHVRTKTLALEVDERTVELIEFNKQLQEQIAVRKKAEQALRVNEERYRNFVEQSTEGIFRLEFNRPIPIDLPMDEQVRLFYSEGYLAECNEVFATMYGAPVKKLIGITLTELHGSADNEENFEAQRAFIRNQYRLADVETQEIDRHGNILAILNSAFGVIHKGRLLRIWGTQQDITERKRIEAQIHASLKEKDVLLKEVHHRVKNNMQIISSLLQLQARRLDDERIINILKESQARVRSMALVHEMLYGSHNLSQIDLAQYIRKLVNSLYSAHGESNGVIHFQFDIQPILISVDLAVPCGLMFNELVTNVLKHAFPDGLHREDENRVNIGCVALNEQRLELTCQDNGVGLPDNFNMEHTTSLGLFLLKILLTEQLGGQLHIVRENGVAFVLEFPYERHQVEILHTD